MSAYFENSHLTDADREAMLSLIKNIRDKLSMLIVLSDINQISLSQSFIDEIAAINRTMTGSSYTSSLPTRTDGDQAGKIASLISTFEALNQSAEKLLLDIDYAERLLIRESAVPLILIEMN